MIFDKRKKSTLGTDYLGWLLIGLIVLISVALGYLVLSGKLSNSIESIKNFLRFGN